MKRRAWTLAVLLSGACACHRASEPAPLGHETPGDSAPPSSGAPPAASPPSASATAISPVVVPTADPKSRVAEFFGQYRDGSDFEFLRAWCASPVERFISMRDTDVDAVITSARQFFRDKRSVKYAPDLAALHIRTEGDVTVASLPLTMSWGVAPPASWKTNGLHEEWLTIGVLDAGLVLHETTVDVELAFAKDGRITRYVEGTVHRRSLRATGFDQCDAVDDEGPGQVPLPKGTVVLDLGETYYTFVSAKGPEIIRLVRFRGKDVWVNDNRFYSVPNPNGGTSAGGGPCLESLPAPDVPR
jgi:hypothetical protein